MPVNIAFNCFCLIRLFGKFTTSLCSLARVFFYYKVPTYPYFTPSERIKHLIKFFRNGRFVSSCFFDISHCQPKIPQTFLQLSPFLRKGIVKNLQRMAIISKLKFFQKVGINIIFKLHPDVPFLYSWGWFICISSHCWRLMSTARGLAPSWGPMMPRISISSMMRAARA